VSVTANAREALETLAHATFDVLVSDIRMPERTATLSPQSQALDAERGGRSRARPHRVYQDRRSRAALSAGYQQHAAKPIEPAELAAAVATLAPARNGNAATEIGYIESPNSPKPQSNLKRRYRRDGGGFERAFECCWAPSAASRRE